MGDVGDLCLISSHKCTIAHVKAHQDLNTIVADVIISVDVLEVSEISQQWTQLGRKCSQ